MEEKKHQVLITHGSESAPMISIMVNVAWGNEYIIDILEYLKERNLSLTFFLEGRWVEQFPEYARMIRDANQEIGNHSYSHQDLTTLSAAEIEMEITNTNKIINEVLGIRPQYFTPPYGYLDKKVLETASYLNMVTVLWSLDTLDWKIEDPSEIIDRIVPNIKNGSIILMHPTKSSLIALPTIIEKAQEKNYHFKSIIQMVNK
ncbi:polysaccharide deacetylase family protein [Bacillus sp. USDA818B3_A]|uniref:polysaccharide deacetylase family protein n=1 Tax=Bacillus sp. USDA818B3_A TaxID=2698834 RepID=UPI00136AD2BF|nr:polysaccharide deacetylase family protein [Bacillus sp. USDA818B3_A]